MKGGFKAVLTRANLAFVQKYVETMNARLSFQHAHPNYHGKNAGVRGHELLGRPAVQAAIEVQRHQVAGELQVTPGEVLRRMMLIGYANPKGMLDEAGKIRDLKDMPDELALAIAEIKVLRTVTYGEGENQITQQVIAYKFWNKPKMLDSLAEHLNLFRGQRSRLPLEDMEPEEIERLTKANEEAIAALQHASRSSRKAVVRAVAKSTEAVNADLAAAEAKESRQLASARPNGGNGAKAPNGKGNGHGGNGHA